MTDEEEDRVRNILVITEILETTAKKSKAKAKGKGKAGKAKAKGKASKAKADASDDDLDDRIAAVVIEALAATDDNELPKAKLPGLMVKAFTDKADKSASIKRVGSPDFLESRDEFEFDADEGTVSL